MTCTASRLPSFECVEHTLNTLLSLLVVSKYGCPFHSRPTHARVSTSRDVSVIWATRMCLTDLAGDGPGGLRHSDTVIPGGGVSRRYGRFPAPRTVGGVRRPAMSGGVTAPLGGVALPIGAAFGMVAGLWGGIGNPETVIRAARLVDRLLLGCFLFVTAVGAVVLYGLHALGVPMHFAPKRSTSSVSSQVACCSAPERRSADTSRAPR